MTRYVVLSDTHRRTGTGLTGRQREAVDGADAVVHAGDFTAAATLDAFRDFDARLYAVHGNSDVPAVRERLPSVRTFTLSGVTVTLTHRARGGATALSLLGRQHGASLVVSGHSHAASVDDEETPVLLDPGSHDEPRGREPTHVELHPVGDGLEGAVRTQNGTRRRSFVVPAPDPE